MMSCKCYKTGIGDSVSKTDCPIHGQKVETKQRCICRYVQAGQAGGMGYSIANPDCPVHYPKTKQESWEEELYSLDFVYIDGQGSVHKAKLGMVESAEDIVKFIKNLLAKKDKEIKELNDEIYLNLRRD